MGRWWAGRGSTRAGAGDGPGRPGRRAAELTRRRPSHPDNSDSLGTPDIQDGTMTTQLRSTLTCPHCGHRMRERLEGVEAAMP
ncbi:Hypothetical protein MexAM1_META2p1005 (plasmid) [Methylorubrum extorquens AM1]|uniref:Uncharacterized protein n=1 Tax=Methylorubrum extorquens (strain ATCC 14718 / DSM 1338 / JCM 2805 / NCIMB 9133 / AM1) TaxID=272630 RepID=C5B5R5_METEA|nr:Hypothetical protein MexAM1_META2p1005 [Methylorubrum extorquens AM1]